MKISKAYVLNRIMIGDTTQRLRGLVMELYFEKVVAAHILKITQAIDFSSGWLRGKIDYSGFYLRIVDDEVNAADEEFVQVLRRSGKVAIFIRPVVLDETLVSYEVIPDKGHSAREEFIGNLICRNASAALVVAAYVPNDVDDLIPFFSSLDLCELMRVFHLRLILNSAGIFGPVDIDGVFLNRERKVWICEFKRKYPAERYYPLLTSISGLSDLESKAFQLSRKEFDLARLAILKKQNEDCFGLDLSHIRNFVAIKEMGLGYLYLILEGVSNLPFSYFSKDFSTDVNVKIIFRRLEYSDFVGVAFTQGGHLETKNEVRRKSGSFHDGKRYQLVIPKAVFAEQISIRADARLS